MHSSINEELGEVRRLIYVGEYFKALEMIESLENWEDLEALDLIKLAYQKANSFFGLGRYEEALELIKENEQDCWQKGSSEVKLDCFLLKANCWIHMGSFKDALDLILAIEIDFSDILTEEKEENIPNIALLSKIKAISYLAQGDRELADRYLYYSLEISKRINHKFGISESLDRIALYSTKVVLEQSIELLNESLIIREEIGNDYFTGQTINRLGNKYNDSHIFDKALDSYLEALQLTEKYDNKDLQSIIHMNIGNVESTLGHLNRAIDHYSKSLKLSTITKNTTIIASTHHNLAGIYRKRGELSQSLDYQLKALEIFEELGNKAPIAAASINIGIIHYGRGDFDNAMKFILRAYKYRKELKEQNGMTFALFFLIQVSLDINQLDKAKEYFEELETVEKQEERKIITQRKKIAEAMLLMKGTRFQNKVEAGKLLSQVIKDEIIDHELTVTALLVNCNLLLEELQIMMNDEVMNEIKETTKQLENIAKTQHSYLLLAQTYWLQSQLALIELDINKAKNLLIQAQFIAEEKEFRGLVLKISLEYDSLLKQAEDWLTIKPQDLEIEDRLTKLNIDDLISRMTRRNSFEIKDFEEENPVYLILLNKSGKTIFTRKFLTLTRLDDALIGGFIAAINSFASEIFETTGHIERIKHQDYTLIIRIHSDFLFAYVYKGQSFTAFSKLSNFVKDVSSIKYLWSSLEELSLTPLNMPENIKVELSRKAEFNLHNLALP